MPADTPDDSRRSLTPIHVLLTIQTLVIIFGSINRLTNLFSAYVLPNEFLRWLDFNNMLVIPLISLVAFYLLKKRLEYDSAAYNSRRHLLLNVMFFVGVYLTGASYGDHEITNYLHARFCDAEASSRICQIIAFNDDEFSHWVFFTGFVLVNLALMLVQTLFPHPGKLSNRDKILLIVNGLFIGAAILANLGFEDIGLDLYVVALLALLAVGLLWRRGLQPLLIYYTTAYMTGLVATIIVQLIR